MTAPLFAIFCALAIVWLGDLRAAAFETSLVLLVWGLGVLTLPRPRLSVRALLVASALIRLALLASEPSLSDDVFRYLWEGRAVAEGGNPYLSPPADPAWGAPDDIRALVNHPEITAIYPPLVMWFCAVVSSVWYDPMSMKLLMGLCDLAVVWLLADILQRRGQGRGPAWLYALHPLGAVESAGSGHLESLGLMMVMLAVRDHERGRPGVAWVGLGAMIKLLPAALLPVVWRRSPALLAAVVGLALVTTMPFADASLFTAIGTYARHWSFNGSLYAILAQLLGDLARPVVVSLWMLAVVVALRRGKNLARVALWAGGAFVLLSPTVHPWYVLWAWLPALLCGVRAWSILATLIPLSYVVLSSYDATTGAWMEPRWLPWVIYPPFFLALLSESLWDWMQPGPWGAGGAKRRSSPASPT